MLDKILEILETSHLFLTGGGGVGKSFVTNQIMSYYKKNGKNVVALGSTGASSVNIGGITLHAFFAFGICKDLKELRQYDKNKRAKDRLENLANILSKTDLLVIDEISMVSSSVFEMIYERLLKFEFGGKLMLVGDFYQLPPITKDENDLFTNKYAFSSYAWEMFKFTNVEFIKSKRTSNLEFYKMISLIRLGKVDDKIISYLSQFVTNPHKCDKNTTTLFGRNKEADELNLLMLDEINSQTQVFTGQIHIENKNVYPEKIDKWINNLNVSRVFEFKVGAKVLFTINKYSFDKSAVDFYNGEQGVIVDVIKDNLGFIESIIIQKSDETIVEVVPNSYEMGEFVTINDEVKYEVIASFCQFPLRLAYGITIHKSQGMSIENLTCNLNHIFTEGQLYVALSRATNPKNLTIVYNRYENFSNYLKRVIKTNSVVDSFYKNEAFIYYD